MQKWRTRSEENQMRQGAAVHAVVRKRAHQAQFVRSHAGVCLLTLRPIIVERP